MKKIRAIAPIYYRNPLFVRISLRYINRPLVFNPTLLSPEEEGYFLPHIFNINENEARTDYIDIHGGRLSGPDQWQHPALMEGLGDLLWAANTLEKLKMHQLMSGSKM